ncbi:MAG: EAL domain-containing protein [Acidobacteria bacterium]|nr:EAL domain-containing protein [Acidobacteriota bacterium]
MDSAKDSQLVGETLLKVIPGARIVATVSLLHREIEGLISTPVVLNLDEMALDTILAATEAHIRSDAELDQFAVDVEGESWDVLLYPITVRDGDVVGALFVAKPEKGWMDHDRALLQSFSSMFSYRISQSMRESQMVLQRRLDSLVSRVAERLMSATSHSRQEAFNWTCEELATFLEADVAFIRSNDLDRGLSVLEAEYPIREDKPDPDPLGEVPFEADPIFMAMRDLKTPYLPGIDNYEDYIQNVETAAGVEPKGGAAVPLLMHGETWGILGFLHFSDHFWIPAEINALQAVAAMLIQLQARIDAEQQIVFNATHDDLTGLPNRRALIQELVERISAGRDTAIMIIDLDRFKVMNDFLGHASGDRLLVTIADRLRTSIRANDFAARLGGDEFVFLVDQITNEMEVLATAYRLLEVISEPVDIHGQFFSHTASIGIAMAGSDQPDALEMLRWADVALYSAKSGGRNQAIVFDESLRRAAHERSQLELSLRDAIDAGQLRLHFQPEVNLQTGELLACEALVRWEHPDRGMVPAVDFISVAEETGLIVNIGRWVFAEACRTLADWDRRYGPQDLVMRINMSPAEFLMEDIVEFVEGCLIVNGISGDRLCIEITEYTVLDKPEKTASILRGFQELGVEVALDDFGTGFASMTELKNLPVNAIKLDLSFVQGINRDPYDRAIVESIILLGRALHLTVIAEGIETPDITDTLVELGCHRGQGYLISRPVPSERLDDLLRKKVLDVSTLRTKTSVGRGVLG